MTRALRLTDVARDPIALARLHAVLRFGTGVTLAFVICEAMGWYPTFLAPLLVGALLANLPSAPPLKMGLMLIVVMAAAALVSFMLPSLLRGTPEVMVGAIGADRVPRLRHHGARTRQITGDCLLLLCMATDSGHRHGRAGAGGRHADGDGARDGGRRAHHVVHACAVAPGSAAGCPARRPRRSLRQR